MLAKQPRVGILVDFDLHRLLKADLRRSTSLPPLDRSQRAQRKLGTSLDQKDGSCFKASLRKRGRFGVAREVTSSCTAGGGRPSNGKHIHRCPSLRLKTKKILNANLNLLALRYLRTKMMGADLPPLVRHDALRVSKPDKSTTAPSTPANRRDSEKPARPPHPNCLPIRSWTT